MSPKEPQGTPSNPKIQINPKGDPKGTHILQKSWKAGKRGETLDAGKQHKTTIFYDSSVIARKESGSTFELYHILLGFKTTNKT